MKFAFNCVHHDRASAGHGLCKVCYGVYYYTLRDKELGKQLDREYHATNHIRKNEYRRRWRNLNKARCQKIARDYRQRLGIDGRRSMDFRRKYGMTLADYYTMLHSQDGRCAICQHPPPSNQRLCLDHNHLSGAIRGLLCRRCNSGIGLLQDSVELLERGISYLNNPPGVPKLEHEPAATSPVSQGT